MTISMAALKLVCRWHMQRVELFVGVEEVARIRKSVGTGNDNSLMMDGSPDNAIGESRGQGRANSERQAALKCILESLEQSSALVCVR